MIVGAVAASQHLSDSRISCMQCLHGPDRWSEFRHESTPRWHGRGCRREIYLGAMVLCMYVRMAFVGFSVAGLLMTAQTPPSTYVSQIISS